MDIPSDFLDSELAVKKAEGVRLGRPTSLPVAVPRRISRLRNRGMTYKAIADTLNDDGVPTGQGGARWYPATVRKVLSRLTDRAA